MNNDGSVLGSGCFGTVVVVVTDGKILARKLLKNRSVFLREFANCAELVRRAHQKHSNTLMLMVNASCTMLTIDFPIATKGDMLDACSETFGITRLAQMIELTRGVEALRTLCVAHCDLKLENILVMADNTVRICDFGGAVLLDNIKDRFTAFDGTVTYCAPEALYSEGTMNANCDLWSLGICIFAMGCGFNPLDVDDEFDRQAIAVRRRASDPRILSHLDARWASWDSSCWMKGVGFAEVVKGLLRYVSSTRWNPSQVMHAFNTPL